MHSSFVETTSTSLGPCRMLYIDDENKKRHDERNDGVKQKLSER